MQLNVYKTDFALNEILSLLKIFSGSENMSENDCKIMFTERILK
jgi:hypothetical protein